jgi:hypothetical protein
MTTLHRVPQPAPSPPPPASPSETPPLGRGDASSVAPAPPAEILPMLVESPAWPRVFPGL